MKTISRARLGELFRYGIGCGCNILFKIAVTACFTFFTAPVWVGYLGAQVLVFFASYFYHSYITFQRRPKNFREHREFFLPYLGSVIFIKLADYLLVVLGAGFLTGILEKHDLLTPGMRQMTVSGIIVAVSGLIFIFRYFLYRFIFHRKAPPPEDDAL